METRIYEVNQEGKDTRLVDASSPSQASRHVAKDVITVTIPSTKRVAALMGKQVRIEQASAPAVVEPTTTPE